MLALPAAGPNVRFMGRMYTRLLGTYKEKKSLRSRGLMACDNFFLQLNVYWPRADFHYFLLESIW